MRRSCNSRRLDRTRPSATSSATWKRSRWPSRAFVRPIAAILAASIGWLLTAGCVHSPRAMSGEGSAMTITIRVTIEGSEGVAGVAEVAHFHRDALRAGNLGLALAEAKALLTSVQKAMVASQTSEWMIQHRRCMTCGAELRRILVYIVPVRSSRRRSMP